MTISVACTVSCSPYSLEQGSPTPGPIKNWAAQQEVSNALASKVSHVFAATPKC